jgi:hypothetical protein
MTTFVIFVLPSGQRIYDWFLVGVTRDEIELFVRRHLASTKPEFADSRMTIEPASAFDSERGRLIADSSRIQLTVRIRDWGRR